MANPRSICALILVVMAVAACGDDPFQVRWEENLRERVLYSLDRDERNRPAGFEMLTGNTVIIEGPGAIGQWDFALDRSDGVLALYPPRAFGVTSNAGIAPIPGADFDEVREAPADTLAYRTRDPVPLEAGTVYVIRTREQQGSFGRRCRYYGKLEAVEIDSEGGVFRFVFDTSPDCNNRSLVPPT